MSIAPKNSMMKRRRRRVSVGSDKSNSDQLLSLSLFLMLLAFFIVLNAISNFEDTKVKPILQSIEKSFAMRQPPEDTNPSVQESDELSVDEGDITDRLEALFRSQIPQFESAMNKSKGIMHVRLPYDDFRDAVMAVGQRNDTGAQAGASGDFKLKAFFLPALIALIRTDKAGVPYHMDMILNVGDDPPHLQNTKPRIAARHIRDMSRLAQKLEMSGLPTKQQTIGLGDGPEGTVDILFRPYVPYDPTGGGASNDISP